MEKVIILAISAALVALLGRNRKIGYGWSFIMCFFLTPIIGLIIILASKKVEPVRSADSEDTVESVDSMGVVDVKKKTNKTEEQ